MESQRFGTMQEAVTEALAGGWRQRAVCYVTRGGGDLLVFEHSPEAGDAGVQLPAGGLEPRETPAQAAAREAREETGLLNLSGPVHLGSCVWSRLDVGAKQVWHYFWLRAPSATPDHWTHTVTGGELDTGMQFHLRFVPVTRPELTPGLGSHEYLPDLSDLLQEHAND